MSYNPRLDRQRAVKKGLPFDYEAIENPIALEVTDPEEVLKTYSDYPLVPYAGDENKSYDGLLTFLDNLSTMSGTLGSCLNSIKIFTLAGKLSINYSGDDEFELPSIDGIDLDPSLPKSYVKFIKDNVKFSDGSISDLYESILTEFGSNGNYAIEVLVVEVNGIKKVKLNSLRTRNYRYVLGGQGNYIAISNKWTQTYLQKHPPRVVGVYPNVSKSKDGSISTVIHVKNGNNVYYGRPLWVQAYAHAFREYQDVNHLIKQAVTDFVGQHFIEIEDDNHETDSLDLDDTSAINEGHGGIMDKIESRMSANSEKPSRVIVATRPYGTKPAFIYSFPNHTKEEFYKITDDISRRKIIESNQWSERLLGNSVVSGFSEDVFIAELKSKEVGIISYLRTKINYGVNLAMRLVLGALEEESFNNLHISNLNLSDKLNKGVGNADKAKVFMDAVSTGIRGGTVTPTLELEQFVRNMLNLPKEDEFVLKAWAEDKGIRRPVSLLQDEEPETTTNDPKKELNE